LSNSITKLSRVAASLAATVAITVICYRFLHVNATTVAFFYLPVVLVIATFWGLLESTIAAVASVLCFNYFFLPPILTFTIADAQNWVALLAFLATAIIGSQLSSYARRQTSEAWRSKLETEQLYSLSRTILLLDEHASAASQLAGHIARLFGFKNVTIFDRYSGAIHAAGAGGECSQDLARELKKVVSQTMIVKDSERRMVIAPIRLGSEPIGSLAAEGVVLTDGALQAILNLIAITIERERQREETTQAQAERKGEKLKATLLDAIAHEFKTPLTSIKAAAGSLLASSVIQKCTTPESAAAHELITVIDEETDRLNELVSDAIQMARIEAGAVKLRKRSCKLQDVLDTLVRDLEKRKDGRMLIVQLSDNLPAFVADPDLMNLTLRQLVGNALKYSPQLSSITITASHQDGQIVIQIRDEGSGISKADQEHIFDKFFRGSANERQVPGAGMGLAIAREVARAHGGDIWVESEVGHGATFSLAVPGGTGP
jgi:two-component system sensor histidine kinase KdpD